jgi:hypothetical protein
MTKRTTIIVLKSSSEGKALKVAKQLAQLAAKTGRTVTVRDPDGAKIDAAMSLTKH